MDMLARLELRGFKSIRQIDGLELRRINVLIGANGAGKSNLISFFKLLAWMTATPGNLQLHVARSGGASSLLHDGAAVTPQMHAALTFATDEGTNEYAFRLFHAARDTFVFAEEKYRFSRRSWGTTAPWVELGAGHKEAELLQAADRGDQTARKTRWLLRHCVVYQFHNTSETARLRQRWSVEDNRYLKEDGANLASFLLRLRDAHPKAYTRIVETLRLLAPFFADFVLDPVEGAVILQWRERGTDLVFGAHQASDGMLRVMALVALLLQPEDELPSVIILDEPELGLHPSAITIVAGLLRAAANHSLVILATQSTAFVDQFEPEDIVVVDRPGRESVFRRLDPSALREWLDEYSLAELWEKNVLGGKPR
jgi:predicted ATPase